MNSKLNEQDPVRILLCSDEVLADAVRLTDDRGFGDGYVYACGCNYGWGYGAGGTYGKGNETGEGDGWGQ